MIILPRQVKLTYPLSWQFAMTTSFQSVYSCWSPSAARIRLRGPTSKSVMRGFTTYATPSFGLRKPRIQDKGPDRPKGTYCLPSRTCSEGLFKDAAFLSEWTPRPWKKDKWIRNIRTSTAPNVQTIVAPVGVSRATEKYTPSAETRVPIVQPIASRGPTRSANSMAPTEGTIR